MNDMNRDIFVSISSGLVLTVLSFVCKDYLYPLILGYVYKAPNISGRWQRIHNEQNNAQSVLEIKQYGTYIRAVLIRSDGLLERRFKYKGVVLSGQLVLHFEEVKAPALNLGTFVLKLNSDLQQLSGMTTYFSHDRNAVVSRSRIFERVN